MTAMKTATQMVATIDDGEIVFSVTGIIDSFEPLQVRVEFKKAQFMSDRTWTLNEYIYSEDDLREFTRNEYIDYIMKYISVVTEVEDIEVEDEDAEDD